MIVDDDFIPEEETPPDEPPPAQWQVWRERLRQYRAPALRVLFFASGVAAALLAVLIYQALTPKPHQLTTSDVRDTIAQAFASATPRSAYSEQVYQVIQPSLVL